MDSEFPILSIVTVASNDLGRLSETINSLSPANGNFEYVVVVPNLDAESQLFLSESREFQKLNSVVVLDLNTGIYPAMNLGLKNCSGKYILYLNAGDVVIDYINFGRFLEFLGGTNSDWIVCQTHFSWRGDLDLTLRNVKRFGELTGENYLSHQSIVARTQILKDLKGFDSRYRVAADTKFICQLIQASNPHFFNLKFVSVQSAMFSAKFQRLARFEVLKIAFDLYRNTDLIIRLKNISRIESLRFLYKFKRLFI